MIKMTDTKRETGDPTMKPRHTKQASSNGGEGPRSKLDQLGFEPIRPRTTHVNMRLIYDRNIYDQYDDTSEEKRRVAAGKRKKFPLHQNARFLENREFRRLQRASYLRDLATAGVHSRLRSESTGQRGDAHTRRQTGGLIHGQRCDARRRSRRLLASHASKPRQAAQ